MIPLEAALDQQNNPQKYAQQDQEKLEKELLNSSTTIERDKWLKHPCTTFLIAQLNDMRDYKLRQAESKGGSFDVTETATLSKFITLIKYGRFELILT